MSAYVKGLVHMSRRAKSQRPAVTQAAPHVMKKRNSKQQAMTSSKTELADHEVPAEGHITTWCAEELGLAQDECAATTTTTEN
ncbi:hypothetical protein ABBQ38_012121 [Trebouxia sp. C0009 RCD-2024]